MKVIAQSGPDYFIFKDSVYNNPIATINNSLKNVPVKSLKIGYIPNGITPDVIDKLLYTDSFFCTFGEP